MAGCRQLLSPCSSPSQRTGSSEGKLQSLAGGCWGRCLLTPGRAKSMPWSVAATSGFLDTPRSEHTEQNTPLSGRTHRADHTLAQLPIVSANLTCALLVGMPQRVHALMPSDEPGPLIGAQQRRREREGHGHAHAQHRRRGPRWRSLFDLERRRRGWRRWRSQVRLQRPELDARRLTLTLWLTMTQLTLTLRQRCPTRALRSSSRSARRGRSSGSIAGIWSGCRGGRAGGRAAPCGRRRGGGRGGGRRARGGPVPDAQRDQRRRRRLAAAEAPVPVRLVPLRSAGGRQCEHRCRHESTASTTYGHATCSVPAVLRRARAASAPRPAARACSSDGSSSTPSSKLRMCSSWSTGLGFLFSLPQAALDRLWEVRMKYASLRQHARPHAAAASTVTLNRMSAPLKLAHEACRVQV